MSSFHKLFPYINSCECYHKDLLAACGGVCGRVVNSSNPGSGGPGSSLARRAVSLDKELYSTLSLFIQEFKWVPATYCWGITLRWTSIPSGCGGKGVAILLFYYLMVTNIQSWMRRILKIKNIY